MTLTLIGDVGSTYHRQKDKMDGSLSSYSQSRVDSRGRQARKTADLTSRSPFDDSLGDHIRHGI